VSLPLYLGLQIMVIFSTPTPDSDSYPVPVASSGPKVFIDTLRLVGDMAEKQGGAVYFDARVRSSSFHNAKT
jgi:hypothetical protein